MTLEVPPFKLSAVELFASADVECRKTTTKKKKKKIKSFWKWKSFEQKGSFEDTQRFQKKCKKVIFISLFYFILFFYYINFNLQPTLNPLFLVDFMYFTVCSA